MLPKVTCRLTKLAENRKTVLVIFTIYSEENKDYLKQEVLNRLVPKVVPFLSLHGH